MAETFRNGLERALTRLDKDDFPITFQWQYLHTGVELFCTFRNRTWWCGPGIILGVQFQKKGKFGRVRTLHSWQSCFFFNQRDLYSKIICKHIAFLKENRQKHIKYKIKIVYNFYKAPKPANIVFDLVKGKYLFLLFFSFLALKIKETIPPGAGLTNFTKHI